VQLAKDLRAVAVDPKGDVVTEVGSATDKALAADIVNGGPLPAVLKDVAKGSGADMTSGIAIVKAVLADFSKTNDRDLIRAVQYLFIRGSHTHDCTAPTQVVANVVMMNTPLNTPQRHGSVPLAHSTPDADQARPGDITHPQLRALVRDARAFTDKRRIEAGDAPFWQPGVHGEPCGALRWARKNAAGGRS